MEALDDFAFKIYQMEANENNELKDFCKDFASFATLKLLLQGKLGHEVMDCSDITKQIGALNEEKKKAASMEDFKYAQKCKQNIDIKEKRLETIKSELKHAAKTLSEELAAVSSGKSEGAAERLLWRKITLQLLEIEIKKF